MGIRALHLSGRRLAQVLRIALLAVRPSQLASGLDIGADPDQATERPRPRATTGPKSNDGTGTDAGGCRFRAQLSTGPQLLASMQPF